MTRAHAALAAGARCCAIRRWWPPASPPRACRPATGGVPGGRPARPALAARTGNTRSAAGVGYWADALGGAVVAIGNAPTALFRLLELIDDGAPVPPPSSAVRSGSSARRSPNRSWSSGRAAWPIWWSPAAGGSAMAAAAVNAIASERE